MNAEFKINGLVLQTERLTLRPFLKSDLQDFYEYAKVDGVGEMAGWKHHENIEKTREILDRFISEDKTFAIVYKENGKVIINTDSHDKDSIDCFFAEMKKQLLDVGFEYTYTIDNGKFVKDYLK